MANAQTITFLDALWGRVPGEQHFLIWTMPDKRSRWFRTSEQGVHSAAETIEGLEDNDVYMGVALAGQSYGGRQRVSAAATVGMSALWADVDYADSGAHKKPNLPPTIDDAIGLVREALPEPSIFVHSGNGLQVWWLFEEHWHFADDRQRAAAADLAQRWNNQLRNVASEHGWTVDATHDLARVMRVPGTLNHKSSPAKTCQILEMSGDVYPVADLQDLVKAATPQQITFPAANDSPPGVGASFASGDVAFELRADAVPPFEKWEALRQADRQVQKTWDRKRTDIGDQSPSGYDMALANYAAMASWTDQEVIDLLIAHRRNHGDDLKLNRPDYYARTLHTARDGAARSNAADAIDTALYKLESTSTEQERDEQRLELLDWLSPMLRTGINRIERYGTEPSHFRMLTEAGWVNLGTVEQLLNQNTVRARMVDITRSVFPRVKAAQWDRIAEAVVRAAIDVDMGPEPTIVGSMNAWLDEYLDQHPPAGEIDESVATSRTPFLSADGYVNIFPSHFRLWLERAENERMSLRDITMRLRMAGGRPWKANVIVAGRPTSRSVWSVDRHVMAEPNTDDDIGESA